MSRITTALRSDLAVEISHFIRHFYLFCSIFFAFGAAFFMRFDASFGQKLFWFLLFVATLGVALNRDSMRRLVFLACGLFLLGGVYVKLYHKMVFSHTPITGKVYVDGIGQVEVIKEYRRPDGSIEAVNITLLNPILHQPSLRGAKRRGNPEKIQKNVFDSSWIAASATPPRNDGVMKKVSQKKMIRSYLNVEGYQELDREFLAQIQGYQQVNWQESPKGKIFPNPPKRISLRLKKHFAHIQRGDHIRLHMMLQPPQKPTFPGDFDFSIYAKSKKIGASGFAFGQVEIIHKAEISNINAWFLALRDSIRIRISNVLEGNNAAIAMAFLIGDKTAISPELMEKIRISGLAHLLSISGFHLSLAGLILFVILRFLLSRSEYVMLHYDLKKIAAVIALFGSFFYLQIAASPLPAQRAFLMIMLVLCALFLNEKINLKRSVITAMLLLILANPYSLFGLGFQLSFTAILVLASTKNLFQTYPSDHVLRRFSKYFLGIILTSILIQIATAPFLMRSFQDVALLGFIANVVAIPLAAFVIMPFGIFALFLMLLGCEKYALIAMGKAIWVMEKLTVFVANLDFSHLTSPKLSAAGLCLAIIGLLIICLFKTRWRYVGILVFLFSFLTLIPSSKPDIAFDRKQRFFVINDDQHGLVFSKKQRASKRLESWLTKFGVDEFKTLKEVEMDDVKCDKIRCIITKKQKILVLLKRNKIADICQEEFDIVINMTKKYRLPDCIGDDKVKVDNMDFHLLSHSTGRHFVYFDGVGLEMLK